MRDGLMCGLRRPRRADYFGHNLAVIGFKVSIPTRVKVGGGGHALSMGRGRGLGRMVRLRKYVPGSVGAFRVGGNAERPNVGHRFSVIKKRLLVL
jgi:hypothetical protein